MIRATAMPTIDDNTKPNSTSNEVAFAATASGRQLLSKDSKIAVGAGTTKVGTWNRRTTTSQNTTVPAARLKAGTSNCRLRQKLLEGGRRSAVSMVRSLIAVLAGDFRSVVHEVDFPRH